MVVADATEAPKVAPMNWLYNGEGNAPLAKASMSIK